VSGADLIGRRARTLADELRSVIEALSSHELDGDALEEAAALARRIGELLEGPRRLRWYETDAEATSLSPSSRRAYLDQSPIRGGRNPLAPPLSIEVGARSDGTPVLRGRARLGMAYEGPPHCVHGGWVAALFDDLLGSTQVLADAPGVTASLEVSYRAVTPIEEDLDFEAWIGEERAGRVVAHATCHAGGALTAEARALFVRADFNELQERMRSRKQRRDGEAPEGASQRGGEK